MSSTSSEKGEKGLAGTSIEPLFVADQVDAMGNVTKLRIVGDYRALNQKTMRAAPNIPRMDDIVNSVVGRGGSANVLKEAAKRLDAVLSQVEAGQQQEPLPLAEELPWWRDSMHRRVSEVRVGDVPGPP
jgi:hypothetical protein